MGHLARWTRRFVLLLLPLLALSACDDATGPKDPIAEAAGTYGLTLLNGRAVPQLYYENGTERWTVASGNLVLRADSSFTKSVLLEIDSYYTGPYTETSRMHGTFTIVGRQITFSVPAGNGYQALSWTGVIADHTISYTLVGDAFTYRRT